MIDVLLMQCCSVASPLLITAGAKLCLVSLVLSACRGIVYLNEMRTCLPW